MAASRLIQSSEESACFLALDDLCFVNVHRWNSYIIVKIFQTKNKFSEMQNAIKSACKTNYCLGLSKEKSEV
jgi:hypothetical protein